MLFGSSSNTEELSLEKLEETLNSSFNRKLNTLESKASRIVNDLSSIKIQFIETCDKFEKLDIEPENENIYIDTTSFVKSQKGFYAKTLKSLIKEWNLSGNEAPNIYDNYNLVLANTEKSINEILQANNRFKKVLYSYADHLDYFKKHFSMIERYRDSLKSEIEKVGNERLEYNSINSQITKLNSLIEEFHFVDKNIISLNETVKFNSGVENSNEEEILGRLQEKEKEFSNFTSEINSLHSRITSYTLPLERPSRKLDHISSRKRQLYTFVIDPINNIQNEHDLSEFKILLDELKKSVESGTIDIKNNSKTNEIISQILNIDLYGLIRNFKEMQYKKTLLQDEIKSMQIQMHKFKEGKTSFEKVSNEINAMKKRHEELNSKIKNTKNEIESLFFQYYKRKISINLNQ